MEILIGAAGDEAELRDFLESHFEIVSIDVAVSETAVQPRRKYRMKLPDAIIWATAITTNSVLVTRNTKDFDPEWEGIRLPYQI